jgi:hypothetical protein
MQLVIRVYPRDFFKKATYKRAEHIIFLLWQNVGRYQVCLMLGRWDFRQTFYMNVRVGHAGIRPAPTGVTEARRDAVEKG